MDTTFDLQTLADDLAEVSRIYAQFLAGNETAQQPSTVRAHEYPV